MADNNIVGSLFGVTPESYLIQRQAQDIAAQKAAGEQAGTMLNPSLAPMYAQAAQQGQMIGRGVTSLLGVEDPQLQAIRGAQELVGKFDTSSSAGLKSLFTALQQKASETGNAAYSAMAQQTAEQYRKVAESEATIGQKRGENLNTLLGTGKYTPESLRDYALTKDPSKLVLIENKLKGAETLLAGGKYTPSSVAKFQQSQNPADLVLVKEADGNMRQDVVSNNGVKAGYVDAKGNFFNNQGRKVTSKEFEDAQKSHDASVDLLYKLQNITESDIKNAYGSLADYTTMPGGKLLGSESAVSAQTKINEVGIRNVLNNLQQLKGASSDKEMAQMIKDFPGYQSDAVTMKKWMDRAVTTANRFLQRSEQRYGFDTEYAPENRFGTQKGKSVPTGAPGSSKENPIKL